MSLVRALKTIQLQPGEGIAHLENLDHPRFMQKLIGYDPWEHPRQAYADAYKALDIDWIIGIPDRVVKVPSEFSSFQSEDGTMYTEWGMSGSAWREEYQFHDIESVLSYDPIRNLENEKIVTPEYNFGEIARRRADQDLMGNSATITGIYYTTLFQFGIMIFNWDLFLMAAVTESDRFQRVLEKFAEVSRRNIIMWAAENMNLIFMHDDIAMERGMVFRPEWYRKHLFPLYEYILEPLKSWQDTKIAFVSDGNYSAVLDDLVSVGFDGFVINSPAMDLGEICRRLGNSIFLAGGIDINLLTQGTPDEVIRGIKECFRLIQPAKGFFMHSGGDLPHNIPMDNLQAYFDTVAELGDRYR